MSEHPVLKYLAISAACEINDKHNQHMLATGQYIPWWKRHLLLVIALGMFSPLLLVGMFIVAANATGPSFWGAVGTLVGWLLPFALVGGGVYAYIRAERRWNRPVNKPTVVVSQKLPSVRRPIP